MRITNSCREYAVTLFPVLHAFLPLFHASRHTHTLSCSFHDTPFSGRRGEKHEIRIVVVSDRKQANLFCTCCAVLRHLLCHKTRFPSFRPDLGFLSGFHYSSDSWYKWTLFQNSLGWVVKMIADALEIRCMKRGSSVSKQRSEVWGWVLHFTTQKQFSKLTKSDIEV